MMAVPILTNLSLRNGHHSLPYILATLAREHGKAVAKFEPRVCLSPVTLFRAKKQLLGRVLDPTLGWGASVNGNLKVYEVPGHQQNMLQEPHVRVVAEKLQMCLSEAQAHEQAR